ncbi:effector-associated domain EAD1-containing protein [Pseudacidovorax sp.]|uniref:GAP1-N1 domain-containing protein n=1 Tax=Pseudacidovorax sp. TaxID=1934311 RepID=UPI0025EDD90D|nr:effector-associated domain EAD1-containing protein [Pseudacidovorax sp.]
MRLHQAIYGAAAGHALLMASDAGLAGQFRNVSWRTDLPQTCPAGVEWAPYFRLIREGAWLMFVHTRRDAAANRGGMVLSRAAFIPHADVESLGDLRPIAAILESPWSEGDGLDPIELGAPSNAENVAEPSQGAVAIATALNGNGPRPIVVRQGQGLEETMFEIWRRAPPEYRSKLTFGLSFGPGDVHELAVVCTPEALMSRWLPAQVIDLQAPIQAGAHAATILDWPGETSVRDFAKQAGLRLDSPVAVAVAVQAFDLWRKPGTPVDDILLLRTLIDASDKLATAEAVKLGATKRVLASAANWTVDNVKALRNLDFSGLAEASMLSDAVQLWVKDRASTAHADGLQEILAAWQTGKPTPMWLAAVEAGFRAASEAKTIQKRGFEAVWQLLRVEAAQASRLLSLLDPTHEKRVLEVVDDSLAAGVADALVPGLLAKGWWHLCGVLLARSRPPFEAVEAALAVSPATKASTQVLLTGALSKASDAEVVDVAIAIQDQHVTKMASQACVRTPSVMKRFDWKRFEWFLLLKQAFDLSPEVLDALPNRKTGLGETIAAQMAVESLWGVVATTPLANILDVNERERAWDLIPSPHSAQILDATARGWLDRFEREEQSLASVEPRLAEVIVAIVKRRGYLIDVLQRAPAAFLLYLSEFGFESDREVYNFLRDLSQSALRLSEAASKALGELIKANEWRDAARDAKDLLVVRTDLKPLYRECYRLLGPIDVLWVSYKLGLPPPLSKDEAWDAFETEAATLYSSGPWHDELWSRSGGHPGDLSNEGSGRASWHRCIRGLRNGMAPGAEAVLHEMAAQHPYNDTLRQLQRQRFWL